MGFLGGLGSLFGGGKGNAPPPHRGKPGAAYMRGERGAVFADWFPSLRDPREDVRAAWWRGAARSVDMIHNSGWIAGLVNKGCSSVLGSGLSLSLTPDYEALGWDRATANEWARAVERRWWLWANSPLECDAAGRHNIHQLARAALRSSFGPGEWVAWIKWVDRPKSLTRTKIQLIPAHRLTQESNGVDLFQGVRIDANGMPRAYRFQMPLPIMETGQIIEVAARDRFRRPVIAHCFDGDVGQMRGISVFAPVLKTLRQFDQLSDATLSTALAQAILAATIESPAPTQDVLSAFETADEQGVGGNIDAYYEARAGWYDNTTVNLGGLSRLVHLFAGEKLQILRSETPNSNFEPFVRWLLRETAACAGFTFEDATGDYTGATYSAIKMATTTNWPLQVWRRSHWATPFYATAFDCWLEELIERGETPFPGGVEAFVANRMAATSAEWRGPAKPVPDEVKFASAMEKLYGMGVITAEYVAAELGQDYEDNLDQLARERDMRKERGIPDPVIITPPPPPDGGGDGENTKDNADG